MPADDWISVKDAARRMGTSEREVCRAIKRGDIPAWKPPHQRAWGVSRRYVDFVVGSEAAALAAVERAVGAVRADTAASATRRAV